MPRKGISVMKTNKGRFGLTWWIKCKNTNSTKPNSLGWWWFLGWLRAFDNHCLLSRMLWNSTLGSKNWRLIYSCFTPLIKYQEWESGLKRQPLDRKWVTSNCEMWWHFFVNFNPDFLFFSFLLSQSLRRGSLRAVVTEEELVREPRGVWSRRNILTILWAWVILIGWSLPFAFSEALKFPCKEFRIFVAQPDRIHHESYGDMMSIWNCTVTKVFNVWNNRISRKFDARRCVGVTNTKYFFTKKSTEIWTYLKDQMEQDEFLQSEFFGIAGVVGVVVAVPGLVANLG